MTATVEQPDRYSQRFTVEHLLYAVILGVALLLRLLALERWPLLDGEAGLALAAWRLARGVSTALRGHSPLLLHANALLFFLTGGSDALLRSWSVLFGSLLVLLPYGLRSRLGRVGALTSALLLAISPSFTYFSRVADGSMVVAFCSLACLVCAIRYAERRDHRYVYGAACLATLSVLAGPLVYTAVLIGLTFPLFLWLRGRLAGKRSALDGLQTLWRNLRADQPTLRTAALVGAAVFICLGTAFTANPLGLQMTLDQMGQWAGAFHLPAGAPWYGSLLLLALYETGPLLTGGLWLLFERDSGSVLQLLLRCWFGLALVVSVIPGRQPLNSVLLLLVPLFLAAGQAAETLWWRSREPSRSPWFWVLLALAGVVVASAYVQLVNYLSFPVNNYLLRIAALGVFLVSAYAMLWSLFGYEVPLRAASVSLAILLLLLMVRAEARVNYARARDPVEPLVGATISPEVLELAAQAARLSSHLEGDPRVMQWQVDRRLEVPLGWYLRGFDRLSYVGKAPSALDAGGLVLLDGEPPPAECVGLRFGLRAERSGARYPLVEWLRWWAGLNSAVTASTTEEVVLWVRQAQ